MGVLLNTEIAPAWLVNLVVGLVVCAVCFLIFLALKDTITAIVSPTKTVNAELTSKFEDLVATTKVFVGARGNVGAGIAEKGKAYYMTFKLDNGKFVTFLVPKGVYDTALENESGMLKYKYKNFISFSGKTEGTKVDNDAIDNNVEFVSLSERF